MSGDGHGYPRPTNVGMPVKAVTRNSHHNTIHAEAAYIFIPPPPHYVDIDYIYSMIAA